MKRRKDHVEPKTLISEDCYQKWIQFLFENGAVDGDIYTEYCQMPHDEMVELIKYTFLRCSLDLQKYSKSQINTGLSELLGTSDFIFSFKEADLHYTDVVIALQSIQHLYKDLFNDRCDPVLSHLDEKTDNELNNICYMLWDITPLAYWPDDPNQKHYYAAIAGVMEKALYLSNPACIESALHGLGHIQNEAEDSVVEIINTFLKKQKNLRPELFTYANHAKIGYVQ